MPLMPAMRPSSSANSTAAAPMSAPPASACHGVNAFQSICTAYDGMMIFRQLFEPVSSTFTYLLGSEETGEAILVDPVLPAWQHDLQLVSSLGLRLAITLETHVHPDHITAALRLKRETGSRIACPAVGHLPCADLQVEEGRPIEAGGIRVDGLYTPGHTADHFAYRVGERVLTGDALLIEGCGRTDFQAGDAATLYRSVHEK